MHELEENIDGRINSNPNDTVATGVIKNENHEKTWNITWII